MLHGFGWQGMGSYGNIAYLTTDPSTLRADLIKKVQDEMGSKAETYLANSKSDGYMVALGDNYCWGSNLSVCSYARQMLFAAKTGSPKKEEYKQAVYDQLTYLLGQNATGYCFATGYGSLSPVNSHHRPSIALGKVMPGMLVGGPDGAKEDSYVKSVLADMPPAKCYADNTQSYSTNEVTIYWNSPFIYLLSAICDPSFSNN